MKPKPKPLHRSLTFWSGIFILLFLGWTWWDSLKMMSYVSRDRYVAFNNYGVITLHKTTHPAPPTVGRSPNPVSAPRLLPVIFCRGGIPPERDVDPLKASYEDQLRLFMSTESRDTWILVIPYWLILLTATLPWTALLLWRARRHRQAMQAIPDPAAIGGSSEM